MDILLWIIFGGLVGWVASIIMNAGSGLVMNIVVGIIGAVLGGWIMKALGQGGVGGFDIYSFLVALLGAVVLIWIVRSIKR